MDIHKIGMIIRSRRKELGITQRELAELAGVGYNSLISIERGEGNPTMDVLNRILDTLGLQISIGVKNYEETENI